MTKRKKKVNGLVYLDVPDLLFLGIKGFGEYVETRLSVSRKGRTCKAESVGPDGVITIRISGEAL